jgi:hypothetical protein
LRAPMLPESLLSFKRPGLAVSAATAATAAGRYVNVGRVLKPILAPGRCCSRLCSKRQWSQGSRATDAPPSYHPTFRQANLRAPTSQERARPGSFSSRVWEHTRRIIAQVLRDRQPHVSSLALVCPCVGTFYSEPPLALDEARTPIQAMAAPGSIRCRNVSAYKVSQTTSADCVTRLA